MLRRSGSAGAIDLVAQFDQATKRPDPSKFTVEDVTLGSETKRAIAPPWRTGNPHHLEGPCPGRRVVACQSGPEARGVAEAGRRRPLHGARLGRQGFGSALHAARGSVQQRRPIADGFPVMVDLSAYGGEQVDLIFNTYASEPKAPVNPDNDLPLWGAPEIVDSMKTGAAARVPLLDLQAQYRPLREEILSAITRVCDSQRFILGPEVDALERELAEHLEVRDAIAVSSGTDALLAAMMALGIGPGDEVVTTTYSFFATAGCISRLGATPRFVDIDPVDVQHRSRGGPSGNHAENPRHDLQCTCTASAPTWIPMLAVARAARDSRSSRTRAGDRRQLSWTPGRLDRHDRRASRSSRARTSARSATPGSSRRATRGWRTRCGCCAITAPSPSTITSGSAAISGSTRCRRRSCGSSCRTSDAGPRCAGRTPPAMSSCSRKAGLDRRGQAARWRASGCTHIYNQFVVRVPDRDRVRARLTERGIGTEIYYPVPFHLQQCFADLGYRPRRLPAG